MQKPALVAGVLVFFVSATLLVAYGFSSLSSRKASTGPTQATSNVAGQTGQAPADGTSQQPSNNAFEFGWVDGNDKIGNQAVEVDITDIVNGKPDVATNQLFDPSRTFKFNAFIAAKETQTSKKLARWGFAYHIFDPEHRIIDKGTGTLNDNGVALVEFSIKPGMAGVYRFRAAVGDSADEDAVVFHLPANYSSELLGW